MQNETLLEMRKFLAPEFVFGVGALDLVGQYAGNLGARKVLVVSDKGVSDAGWTDRVLASLKREGLPLAVFTDVTPNPREQEVMEGAALFLREGCDAIVAVGGGSPMDCAKGIGIVAAQGGHILDYEGVDQISVPIAPLICLPTTSGSGAEVSQFCIVVDQKRKVKIAIVSKAVVPDVALVDPETTTTKDPYLTACTGLDALVHAVEAYVSNTSSAVTDLHALEAVRLIIQCLPQAMESRENLEVRAKLSLASLQAGLAFSNAILGAVHALSHSLGGLLDLPHGECNAILLEHVVEYNFYACVERYRDIASAMGIRVEGAPDDELLDALLTGIKRFRRSVGVSRTLSELGVVKADLKELSAKAHADACLITNPRSADLADIEAIYEQAL